MLTQPSVMAVLLKSQLLADPVLLLGVTGTMSIGTIGLALYAVRPPEQSVISNEKLPGAVAAGSRFPHRSANICP